MRKLLHFQPQLVTANFFPKYRRCPDKINHGQCFIWAWLCHRIFRDVVLCDSDNHAFVKYGDKFYDSERLAGMSDWRDLPATQGWDNPARWFTARHFQKEWEFCLPMYGETWSSLNNKAARFLRGHQ